MVDSPSGSGPSGGGSLRDVPLLLLLLFPLQKRFAWSALGANRTRGNSPAPRKELVQRERMPARLPARLSAALDNARRSDNAPERLRTRVSFQRKLLQRFLQVKARR